MSVSGFHRRLMAAGVLFCALVGGAAQAAPAMWEVRDHDTRIYLFGSMHLLAPTATSCTPGRIISAAIVRAQASLRRLSRVS